MQSLIIEYDLEEDLNKFYRLKLEDLKSLIKSRQILPNLIFSDKNCYYQYHNFLDKIISLQPRKFSYPPTLDLPDSDDIQKGFEALKFDIEKGNNLNKYQSDKIVNANFQDSMFDRDDLFHFHLSDEIQTKKKYKGFVKRTDYLAIAKVTDSEVRIIDIVPHTHQDEKEAIANGLKGTDLTFCNMGYFEKLEEDAPELLNNLKIQNSVLEPTFYEPIKKAVLRKKGYLTFNTTSKNNMYFEDSKNLRISQRKTMNKRLIEEDIKLIGLQLLKYILEKNTSRITLKYESMDEYQINRIFIWCQNAERLIIRVTTKVNSGEKIIQLSKLPNANEVRPNVKTKKRLLSDLGSLAPPTYTN
ncbi:hypothetical protein F4W09_15425 [Acinetobacter tandoii]|uniref:Uncharacterized protein n=1 Tax=Acinetobacter tandoii TaxID=202954 RepID=A0A5N4W8X2_9GAMM|nr:hypothetical protein [Acinetobacter tandoii]KAB1851979.1 hypothetical protein F4W09_15425 [Acinetobacter tandoii]